MIWSRKGKSKRCAIELILLVGVYNISNDWKNLWNVGISIIYWEISHRFLPVALSTIPRAVEWPRLLRISTRRWEMMSSSGSSSVHREWITSLCLVLLYLEEACSVAAVHLKTTWHTLIIVGPFSNCQSLVSFSSFSDCQSHVIIWKTIKETAVRKRFHFLVIWIDQLGIIQNQITFWNAL